MPLTFNLAVSGTINGTVTATLDDATIAAIRGTGPVVVPPVVTPPIVTPPISAGDPRLARVRAAPCQWAIFTSNLLSASENVALDEMYGAGYCARRLQHYTYNSPVYGRYRVTTTGWEYDYAAPDGSRWIPWFGPGDPPGQAPFEG